MLEPDILIKLELLAIILIFISQILVQIVFHIYSKQENSFGMTGADVAREMLLCYGICDIEIERVSGKLSDHYDPKSRCIRLSDDVYGSTSIAAIAVAAHEVGHAFQHDEEYAPFTLRSALFPVASFSSVAWPYVIILGFFLSMPKLLYLGIIFFSMYFIFSVVTLPLEFNASARALDFIKNESTLGDYELSCARKVLIAAAFTYIAAAFYQLIKLLRLLSNTRRR